VFTPAGSVLCAECHLGYKAGGWSARTFSDPRSAEVQAGLDEAIAEDEELYPGVCTPCDATCMLHRYDVALYSKIRQLWLPELGDSVAVWQTGGMCAAIGVDLSNGSLTDNPVESPPSGKPESTFHVLLTEQNEDSDITLENTKLWIGLFDEDVYDYGVDISGDRSLSVDEALKVVLALKEEPEVCARMAPENLSDWVRDVLAERADPEASRDKDDDIVECPECGAERFRDDDCDETADPPRPRKPRRTVLGDPPYWPRRLLRHPILRQGRKRADRLSERCFYRSQSWHYELTASFPDVPAGERAAKLRVKIERNAMDFQSNAWVLRWNGEEWKSVVWAPITELECSEVSYVDKDVGPHRFTNDAINLLTEAVEILS